MEQTELTTYSAWDASIESYLRGDADDTYIRPLFSILPDDPREDDPEHRTCPICQTFDFGSRWVPDNGGAWVLSSSWQASKHSIEKYEERVCDFTNL